MRTVYVVHDGGHDYQEAEKWGSRHFLQAGHIDKPDVEALLALTQEGLAESGPNDFILPSGPTILNILTASEFMRKHQRLNLLLWTKELRYVPKIGLFAL